jgi:5-methylcytosine-specific restriction endonuclease McrA
MSIGTICPACGEISIGRCACRHSPYEVRRSVYDSPRWRNYTRPIVLERDDRTCCSCGGPGTVVDHVVPIGLLLELELDVFDPAECQTLCLSCSGRKDGQRSSTPRSPVAG